MRLWATKLSTVARPIRLLTGVRNLSTVSGGSNRYRQLYADSITDPEQFWAKAGKKYVSWQQPFVDAVELNTTEGVLQYYSGGKLNVSTNCIDRHVFAGHGEKTAIYWEKDEPGETEAISFMTLMFEVSRLANVLKRSGVRRGDVVTIYVRRCTRANRRTAQLASSDSPQT